MLSIKKSALAAATVFLSLAVGMTQSHAAPILSSKSHHNNLTASEVSEPDLAQFISYNPINGLLEFDLESAVHSGIQYDEAWEYRENIESLSVSQVDELFTAFNVEKPTIDVSHEPTDEALPVLLVIALKAIGGGALSAVSAAVARYGLAGACKQLRGKYGVFDDFCRANNW